MDQHKLTKNAKTEEIKKEYQNFLDQLDLLKKEQKRLIGKYGKKLEQRKLLKLREFLRVKK